jgi:hypothetical protein
MAVLMVSVSFQGLYAQEETSVPEAAVEPAVSAASAASYYQWIPLIRRVVPPPVFSGAPDPNSANQWTVAWTHPAPTSTYELQESHTPDFAVATSYDTGTAKFKLISHGPSIDNTYYYRVRAWSNGESGSWSQTLQVVGGYYDDFSNPATNWHIVRQDTDDTENSTWYQDGSFVMRVGGRWDYAIASMPAVAPALPYEIRTSVRLEEPKNLNTYGIIFGGDWNGAYCPAPDYSSCFNHYYRLSVTWYADDAGRLRVTLKRIDYHDSNNVGRGVTLFGPYDVPVIGIPRDWHEWKVKVYASGLIQVYVDGTTFAGSAVDTTYINDPLFGGFAATDEYLGARPFYDWFTAMGMD